MFVELDNRCDDGLDVSLEWDRQTGETRVVVHDDRSASMIVVEVPGASAADAFRHPFRYVR